MIQPKVSRHFPGIRVHQFQLGTISIDLEAYFQNSTYRNQRTLLASNVFVIERDQDVWFLDSGYSNDIESDFITTRLKYSFANVLDRYNAHFDQYLILSHCHPDHIGGLIQCMDTIIERDMKVFLNTDLLDIDYYEEYPQIRHFLMSDLLTSGRVFPLQRCELTDIVADGGHTPEHSALAIRGTDLVYAGDLIPTHYHMSHLPLGERNANQALFEAHREKIKSSASQLILCHAPNTAFQPL